MCSGNSNSGLAILDEGEVPRLDMLDDFNDWFLNLSRPDSMATSLSPCGAPEWLV
jgi:hypothetical protein